MYVRLRKYKYKGKGPLIISRGGVADESFRAVGNARDRLNVSAVRLDHGNFSNDAFAIHVLISRSTWSTITYSDISELYRGYIRAIWYIVADNKEIRAAHSRLIPFVYFTP